MTMYTNMDLRNVKPQATASKLERLVMFLLGVFKWYVWHWRCAYFGHKWVEIGGRPCPMPEAALIEDCYQPVFECGRCCEQDYGDEDGPGQEVCNKHCTET